MRGLVVFAERLAVVGREYDERPAAGSAGGGERIEQRRERGVGGGHVAKVRIVRKTRRERLGRRVREVRLVQVHPAQVRPVCRIAGDPAPGERDGVGPAPLLLQERWPGLRIDETVLVDVEAAVEAETRIERERTDERARTIAVGLQNRGERVDGCRKAEAGVVANAVLGRVLARQNVRMRWQRGDVVGVRVLEADAGGRQAIDRRRARVAVSVRADGVGAECIDGNKENVKTGLAMRLRREASPAPRAGGEGQAQRDDREDAQGSPARAIGFRLSGSVRGGHSVHRRNPASIKAP